jgi:ABC-type multidrug transport system ATPase subunit
VHIANLTVEETLDFAARLRIGTEYSEVSPYEPLQYK